MTTTPIHVSVGLIRKADDPTMFLLRRRPRRGHFAGQWEFPGGKQERGESAHNALVRELLEETNVLVLAPGSLGKRAAEVEAAWTAIEALARAA